MRVFQVLVDVNRYQYFLTKREDDGWDLLMNGLPRADHWSPPPVYIIDPNHEPGDFYNFTSSALIASPRATDVLAEHFHAAGELLPLPYNGQIFTVLNITPRSDALDEERTEWIYGEDTGARIRIRKYAFHPDRLAGKTLFKTKWGRYGETLLAEGAGSPRGEFREAVESAGLKGLYFKEIWNDEK